MEVVYLKEKFWNLNYKGTENSKLTSLGHAYSDGY